MTELFISIYKYFARHRFQMWLSMVLLFIVSGFFATQIHLEEDLGKLMPESKNPDGTTKMAFADLRIKDKTYLLFEAKGKKDTEKLTAICDEFVDSLVARDKKRDKSSQAIGDVFYNVPEDIMFDAMGYVTEHFPSYIDTAAYASFDSLLTLPHMQEQMKQNAEDMQGEFGDMFPELLQLDPIGMRNVLAKQFEPILQSTGGTYKTIDGHFFVADSTVCVAFITPQFSSTNTGQGNILFEDLNQLIDKFEAAHPDTKIVYHGTPASGYNNSTVIKSDLMGEVIGSLVLVLLVLCIVMRNWTTIIYLTLPVAFGTLAALALMYFVKGQFSLLALGIGAVVLGVAISYVLHVMTHYKYVGDPEQVLRDEVKPVLLGCVTTIGSFMGLIFIKTDLLQDFGLFAAFAIVATTLFSLVYLPHLMALEKNRINKRAFAVIDKFNNYPFDRKRPLLAVIGVVTVICIGFYIAKGTDFDADMRNLNYAAERTDYSENLLDAKTYSADKTQYFAAQGKTMEEALNNFSILAAKLDSLQHEGLVKDYTHTNVLFVPLKVQQERINAWKRYWTPERLQKVRSLIAATAPATGLTTDGYDTFFDAATADYEPSPLYKAGIIPLGFQSTLMEQTAAGDYLCFTSVRCAKDTVRSKNTDYYRICDAIASQPNMLVLDTYFYTTDGLENLNNDFNVLQWVSMAFVFVVLLLSFRGKISYTLLGFAPILLSWIIVLGAIAIFDVRFNLINIIISTFIFGVGVDYSIFVMSGLTGSSEKTFAYHKTAILFSAFILIVTVTSMLLAEHPAIKSVGFATLVGMVSAVVLSYVVQPAVFRLLQRKNKA